MRDAPALFSLRGLRCLVTGAGSGIGKATAEVLARQGAQVALNDIAIISEADVRSGGCVAPEGTRGDMTDSAQARRAVAAVVELFGGIDILVNNAAAPVPLARFDEVAPDDWPTHLSSMYATLNCTRAALPLMAAQRWGRIVNVTSIAGGIGVSRMVLYGTGKGAIHAFTAGIAKEIADTGVTINCVAPGTVDTPRQRARDPEERRERMGRVPMGRFAKPEEIAATVAFLVSREAGYITGEVLYVDGGRP